ncbi:MAG: serine/threonine-protein kinase, partial [Planctomycetota bacterium]
MTPRGPDSSTSANAAEFQRLARVDEVLTAELAKVQGQSKPDVSEIVRRHPDIEKELRAALGGAIQLDRAARSASPAEAPLPARLDNYSVIRELGRGGMGVVAEAHDVELDRRVAIKILPAAVSADAEYAARFQREAHAAARLEHPHVIPIYGVGEAGGQAYIAMKLVDGHGLDELLFELKQEARAHQQEHRSGSKPSHSRTVARRLIRERLGRVGSDASDESSWSSAEQDDDDSRLHLGANYHRNVARIGLGIASALSYAHARGVLHRDIKPGNILLDRRGHVWVADFGLAKVEEADDVTREGEFVGTLRYMAPEQFQGHAEPRSDTYSLGLLLYELLTLRRAVDATDRAGLAYAVLHQDPKRPTSIRAEIPADLERIVMKACAKLQEERYRTASDLAADLRAYLDGRPIAARMPSALYLTRLAVHRNRTLFTTVAILAGLLILGAIAYVAELR